MVKMHVVFNLKINFMVQKSETISKNTSIIATVLNVILFLFFFLIRETTTSGVPHSPGLLQRSATSTVARLQEEEAAELHNRWNTCVNLELRHPDVSA